MNLAVYKTTIHTQFTDEIQCFIESVVFGHSGVRYQRLDVPKQCSRFNAPTVLCLRQGSELIGTYVLDPRDCLVNNEPALGIYRGLLCVHPDHQGKGASTALIDQSIDLIKQWAQSSDLAVFSYGCIESNNTPSLRLLSNAGCDAIGHLQAQLLYRQWPKSVVELKELSAEIASESSLMDISIGLWDVTNRPSSRLALSDAEGVKISANAVKTGLKMQTLGAFNDAVVRWFVKPFPFARRRFNPDSFQYIALSQVYVRPGCEGDWQDYVSSIMARYGLHYVQLIGDPNSTVLQQLQTHRVIDAEKGSRIDVMFRAENKKATVLSAQSPSIQLYPVDL